MSNELRIRGHLVDIHTRTVSRQELVITDGRIAGREQLDGPPEPGEGYIVPGLVDAHIHIESTMLTPAAFARAAVRHGTVATVSDPHEIANVLGTPGVEFMLENARMVPFKFCFGAPSCVPATQSETAGARLDAAAVETLLQREDVHYLSEVMDWPGVLQRESGVMAKIAAARTAGKPVDGHAPGLRGEDARRYAEAGISTDHECFTEDEARDKLEAGMHILVREGSAARNFAALIGLASGHADRMMFCSDDKHPDELLEGHINQLVARAVAAGVDLFDALRMASINPIEHYGLPVGTLRVGDPADLLVVEDLERFAVQQTWIDGRLVAEGGTSLIEPVATDTPNRFRSATTSVAGFHVPAEGTRLRVIGAIDGEIVTEERALPARIVDGRAVSDPDRDLLKLAVVSRYDPGPPACAFIQGFGLTRGAIAASVAHDSHNIVAVGVDDAALCAAVNRLIELGGGLVATDGQREASMALPVAGLMSDLQAEEAAGAYRAVDALAHELGCRLHAPYMTLSFMALLVIPALKLSDRGLFDAREFCFVSPWLD